MISSQTSQELTDVPASVSKRMQILIDGKEEKGLRLYIFRLEYKGQQPIRPNDFEIPLRGHISNNRKLLVVQKSTTLEGPYKFDRVSERRVRDEHAPVHFEVNLLDDHNFEIKPLLMNPGEWTGVEIYTSAAEPTNYSAPKDSTEKYKELSSEITWSCHIANVECPGTLDLERDFEFLGLNEPSFLQVHVLHQGWSVYAIVVFTIVNLVVLVLLSVTAGFKKLATSLQLTMFCCGIALSLASAEVLADWLLPYRLFGMKVFEEQPLYAWVIFWGYISVILALLVISIMRSKRQKRPPRKRIVASEQALAPVADGQQ